MRRDFTKQLSYDILRKGVLDDIKWCLRDLNAEELVEIHVLLVKWRSGAKKAKKKRSPGHEAE
jgi:hypothetical protein